MPAETERAPRFETPVATPEAAVGRSGEYTSKDVSTVTLDEALAGGPVVLAFFPGVYSRTCTEELCAMRDWWDDLASLDATVYGVSADTPFSQLAFIDAYDISFPLLSGFGNDVIERYGVCREEGVLAGIAERAVFVIAPDGTVAYRWVVYEPQILPDTDAIEEHVEDAHESA
jgi:glutaredoxin-dependent peroxiredoxin